LLNRVKQIVLRSHIKSHIAAEELMFEALPSDFIVDPSAR